MQILGLHRAVYRGARLSSNLEAKECCDAAKRGEARRRLVDRWLQARRVGLTAEAAGRAIGEPTSTLYRWKKQLTPKSTRPHNVRKPRCEPKLVAAVQSPNQSPNFYVMRGDHESQDRTANCVNQLKLWGFMSASETG